MIEVTLITNEGAGLPQRISIVEGTTLEKFLEVSFDGDPDEYTIRIRANGTTVDAHQDYILQDDDRVSLAPTKVEGETKRGPGTNEEQIKTLNGKVGESGINEAHSIVNEYHPNIVALAYKLMRANASMNKLPKAMTKMLSNLPNKDAEAVRDILLQAKNGPKMS